MAVPASVTPPGLPLTQGEEQGANLPPNEEEIAPAEDWYQSGFTTGHRLRTLGARLHPDVFDTPGIGRKRGSYLVPLAYEPDIQAKGRTDSL
jgi:hypothetical protein